MSKGKEMRISLAHVAGGEGTLQAAVENVSWNNYIIL